MMPHLPEPDTEDLERRTEAFYAGHKRGYLIWRWLALYAALAIVIVLAIVILSGGGR